MRSPLTLKAGLFSDVGKLNAVFTPDRFLREQNTTGAAGRPGAGSKMELRQFTLMPDRGEKAIAASPRKSGWQHPTGLMTFRHKPGSEYAWKQRDAREGRDGAICLGNHPDNLFRKSMRDYPVNVKVPLRPDWRNAGQRHKWGHKIHYSMRQEMVSL